MERAMQLPGTSSMLAYAAIGAALLISATAVYLWSSRGQLYRQLAERQRSLRDASAGSSLLGSTPSALPGFGEFLAVVPNLLPAETLQRMAAETEALVATERTYLPTHKQGGTVAYETLCKAAPAVVALYLSPALHDVISRIVGARVMPTPLHDQSSCSVLFYERPGDHIGWHFDHNFYRGRHFTVLIPIVNRGHDSDGLSAARLMAKVGREERTIPTPPNQMIVFEGNKILHKVTPIREGERRVVLSMTFCTDPRNSLVQGIARRIKDTAFFGIRALWT
jgi:hypothetical protein